MTVNSDPGAERCEFSNCRRPATHRVIELGRYYEDVCSSHVAPATYQESKYVNSTDIEVRIL